MRKISLILGIFFLIILDQWSKFWIVNHIQLGEMRRFLPGIFNLTYLQNHGAAFSLLQHQQWLFIIITFVVIGSAIYYFLKHTRGNYWLLLGLSLVIAGGLGNFIDRIRLGYVVDMIALDFMNFAIFNLADSYLTVGVVLVMITLWKDEEAWK